MSTVQEPRPQPKYERFLEDRLDRAREQVRWTDIGVGALGLLALTFAYGLVMLGLDRWLHLPAITRQMMLFGFVVAAGWYVYRVLLTPIRNAVNPYYAARKVEHTLPDAKNSLMSWLDMRDQPIAAPIRDALGRKAAGDLSKADLNEAVRDRRLSHAGALAALLGVAVVLSLLILRPPQFFSLIERTFMPFSSTAIAAQTQIVLIEPKGGNVTVPVHQTVTIKVDIDGRVPKADAPDAMRLRLRYQPSDPVWEERKLDQSPDRPTEWTTRIPSAQVRTGFDYQITGGDAATPIYHVGVRAKALITDFEVIYKYRPYLNYKDDLRADPNLSAIRGTLVTLLAKTNRPVAAGHMTFIPTEGAGPPPLAAEIIADRPDTLKFAFTLDQSGKYRLKFTTTDGEASEETMPFDITMLPDLPPKVEVTKPAGNPLAPNGILFVQGKAVDDFGLTKARLAFKMRSAAGAAPEALKPVLHGDGKPLTLPTGELPRSLELKEAVPIESLVDLAGGKPIWKAGMVLEYMLEVEDNYDNPNPQIGRSQSYQVTIGEPLTPEQQQQQAKAAADQTKQDPQENSGKPDQGKPDQGKQDQDKQDPNKQDQPKPDQQQPNGDKQPEGNQQPDSKPQPLTPDDKKTIEKAKQLADALQDKHQQKDQNGEQEPPKDQQRNPDAKNQPQDQQSKPDGKQQQGEKGNAGSQPKPDQGSKGDKQGQPDSKNGQSQGDGQKPDGNDKQSGEPKPDGSKNQGQPQGNDQKGDKNQKPDGNQAGSKPDQPQGKDGNNNGDKADPNQSKSQGETNSDKSGSEQSKGDNKQGNDSGSKPDGTPKPGDKQNGQPQGEKGDGTKPQDKQAGDPKQGEKPGEKSGEKGEGSKSQDKQPVGKSDGNDPKQGDKPGTQAQGEKSKPGETGKPGDEQGTKNDGNKNSTQGQSTKDHQGEKTDRKGEKPGPGEAGKPNDQDPKSSPNKGNADGGKGSSQRGGENPKGEKGDKPDQQAKGGQSDPNAKSSNDSNKDANPSDGGKAGDQKGKTEPGKGTEGAKKDTTKPDQPGNLEDAPNGMKDGEKKHVNKPDANGKNAENGENGEGVQGDPKPADKPQQGEGGESKGEYLKKLIDEFKNADPQTQKQILDKMAELAKNAPKPKGDSKSGGNEPKPADLQKAVDALKNADPQSQKQVLDKLADMAKDMPSPKDAGKPHDGAKSDGQPSDKTDPNAKPLPDAKAQPGDKDQPKGERGNKQDGTPQPGDGQPGGDRNQPGDLNPKSLEGTDPNKEFIRKSGDLQLEDFRKKVDRKVLERAKMTEEEYRDFLKAYEKLVQKQKAEDQAKPGDRVRGDAKGNSAANSGAKRVEGQQNGPKTERGGRGQPPPEYRDQYREFTEQQSKQSGAKP